MNPAMTLDTFPRAGQLRLLPPRWVLLSVLAHGLIIAFAKGLPAPAAPLPRLEVRLALPKPAAPSLTTAVAPRLEVKKPETVVRPAPILTRQEAPARAPATPVVAQAPAETAPEPRPLTPSPSPRMGEGSVVSRSAAVAELAPRMDDDGAPSRSDLGAYGESFGRWLARHRSYPRLAQLRGWQGQVEVRVHVAKKGSVIDVVVTHSSGFEVLDRQALDMVKQADPLPDLPKSLKGQEFTLDIPITFRLEQS